MNNLVEQLDDEENVLNSNKNLKGKQKSAKFIRRKNRTDVTRNTITELCGIKIVDQVKYLGLTIKLNRVQMLKQIKTDMKKYVNYFKSKLHTTVEGLNSAITAAYAGSLFTFMLPPLVANDFLGKNELTAIWIAILKKV